MKKLSDINESVWADIYDRSTGETVRKEDDVNLFDIDGVKEYIKKNYSWKEFVHFKGIEPFTDTDRELTIPLFERRGIIFTLEYIMGEYTKDMEFKSDENVILINASVENYMNNLYLELDDNYTLEKIYRSNKFSNYFKITPKYTSVPVTNSFLIDVIDFIIENADDARDNKIKKRTVNESVWADIYDRSTGETIRKEDDVTNLKDIVSIDFGENFSVLWADRDLEWKDGSCYFDYFEVNDILEKSEWRLPTRNEYHQLFENTRIEKNTDDVYILSQNGYDITFDKKGCIFSNSDEISKKGRYFAWTSTSADISDTYIIMCIGPWTFFKNMYTKNKPCVRLVKDKK